MLQLHSVSDCRQCPIDFSSGSITVCEGKVHRISSVYKSRCDYQDHSNHSFHCLIPCSIALHLFLVRLLSNTRLYKAIGACNIMYDTDLQRGRAVTSMFHDVTIEIHVYARFQSLLPLYYLCLDIQMRYVVASVVTDRYTDRHTHTHTHTQNDYRNPMAHAPRVNELLTFYIHTQPHTHTHIHIASYPGVRRGGERERLVHTVCACT